VLRLSALAHQAAADPLARGVLRGLFALALLGGIVALAAIAVAVAGGARDRGGEQAELEAIGVSPRILRAQMVATATVTVVAGMCAGLLGGAALASAFTGLVALGADGRTPLPQLLPAFPWLLAITLAAAAAAIATLAAAAQARAAFRGTAVGRLRG
jgi:ABC-type antimicrobial peptide transport system permease subunit